MEAIKDFKDRVIKEWDAADEETKKNVIADYEALPSPHDGMREYKDAMHKLWDKYSDDELSLKSEDSETIHKNNVKAVDRLIQNLMTRVEKKIGKVISCEGVHTKPDNEGYAVLNGWFEGENGTCEVKSVRAGGYNIQKRHIRVLVK